MSDSGLGPKLIFANEFFRIEHFVDGRALSVWEMRNPQIMKQVAKAIYHFHHSSGAADKVLGLKPINKDKLAIDHYLIDWGAQAEARIHKIRSKLTLSNPDHLQISQDLDFLEATYMTADYLERFRSLVPREDIVLSHSDLHNLNMLASNKNVTDLMIIDYDFADWNPEMFDLAHYLNNLCLDAGHPGKDSPMKYYL